MSESLQAAPLGLWPAVWKLLRLRALITLSGLRRASGRAKFGYCLLALFGLMIVAFVFVLSFLLLRALRSPELAALVPDAAGFVASVPVLLVAVAFLVILITSFGVLLQAMYLAGDMDFLLSAPIPIRAVFLSKLLQAILPNLGLVCLVALPVLFGLGASGGYSPLYYPLVVVMLAALALAAAGIASLLVMAVVRVFPARRVAEVLGFFGALVSIVCSQSGQFARGADITREQAGAALHVLGGLDVPWSPLAWAGRGLVGLGEGRWPAGVGYSLLALAATGLVFGLALTSAERLYYSGWASMQAKARGKRKAPHPGGRAAPLPLAMPGERFLPPAVAAIVGKDWAMLRRDLRVLSQLVTPLILGAVYALMLMRNGGMLQTGQGEAPAWVMRALRGGLIYANVAFSLFVGLTLLSHLAAMGFSQEGRSYWMLKAAPVSTGQLLAAKYVAAYVPVLALGWLFVTALAFLQRSGLAALWFSLAVVAACLAAECGIYLAFGVANARFDWEDPRRMISGSTGCLGAVVTGLALAVALALFALPQIGLALLGWPTLAAQAVGLLVGGAFCVGCAVVPLRIVWDRVPRLDEA